MIYYSLLQPIKYLSVRTILALSTFRTTPDRESVNAGMRAKLESVDISHYWSKLRQTPTWASQTKSGNCVIGK